MSPERQNHPIAPGIPGVLSGSDTALLIQRLPKVELHLHLEGSMQPQTLEELAIRKPWLRPKVADWIAERQRESYCYGSFQRFLAAFGLVSLLLETPEDYALITARLLEWLGKQNVRYAEITLAAGVLLWKKQAVDAVFEAILEAAARAEEQSGVRVNWIFDAVRQFGVDHVRLVLDWANRYKDHGVLGFGIGGDETRGPAELFVDVFRQARDSGLHVTAHAGEAAGPESIRKTVELLGAERIGHGLTAPQDQEVMALLRDRQIPLEVCPTSNVCTGLLRRFQDHPLPKFLEAGLVVTLNSDDPGMFGTSLTDEFRLAARHFALSGNQLARLCADGIRAAFLPEPDKAILLKQLQDEACRDPL